MSKTRHSFPIPWLLIFSILLSFAYLFFNQITDFTIQNHTPIIRLASILPLILLFFLLIFGIWMGYASLFSRLFRLDRREFLHQDFVSYLPLIFLILLPLLLTFYLDSNDLLTRANIFLGSILLAILYLKVATLHSFSQNKDFPLKRFGKKISSLSLKKKLVILFFISLVLYNAGSLLLTSSGQTFAGDEPHYLLISHSLLNDGDVDLANNYANKDYQKIMLPEIIIALFSLTVFRMLRYSSTLSKSKLVFIGLLLSCFIWFHAIKYFFILVPLFIYSFWVLLKKFKTGWNILYFFIFPSLLTFIYFLLQHTFYGSFSLAAVSWRGAMAPKESLEYLKTIVTGIPFRNRWETLAGYFFDQRDGLFLYAPIYFFAFLGCIEIMRRNFRYFLLLLFLSAPYVLNSAFLTQRTGYAPQARPLVAVSWILAILIGYFLVFNAKKIFSIIFWIFAFIGFCIVFLLLKNPLALYQLTTAGISDRFGNLFLQLSNLSFSLFKYLPSYIKINNTGWFPNYAWIGGTLLFIALYIVIRKHSFRIKMPYHLGMTSIGILILFFWLALYPRTVLLYPQNTTYSTGQKITFYSIGRVAQMIEPGKFHLPRDNRAYIFHFTSWRKIKECQIDFGSTEGVFDVEVDLFDVALFKGQTSHNIQTLQLTTPSFYRFKNTNLYRLSIHLKRKSGVIAFSKPFLFSIQPIT